MSLRVRVLTTTSEMYEVSGEWTRLLDRTGTRSIFSSPGFCIAWWKAFGSSRSLQLRLVLVEDSQGIRLVAPLIERDSAPGELFPIGYYYADYTDLLTSSNDEESVDYLLDWLFRESICSKLMLRNLPKESPLFARCGKAPGITSPFPRRLLSALDIRRPPVFASICPGHHRADFQLIQQCRDILRGDHYKRKINWFKRQGKLAYEIVTDRDACRELLPAFFAMHLSEWTERWQESEEQYCEQSMSFAEADNREFFYNLVDELSPMCLLRFDVLSLDGVPIAMQFGFNFNGRLQWYKSCFEQNYSQRSPGKILFGYAITNAAETGLQEMDGMGSYVGIGSQAVDMGSLVMYRTNHDAIWEELRMLISKARVRIVGGTGLPVTTNTTF